MTRLAARLALSGGRESALRLALTALGVALGTTLLLLAVAADPAIRAHQQRQAWQYTGHEEAEHGGSGSPLLWLLLPDWVAGEEMLVLRVAATGPDAPVPLGLDRVPAPGELFVSAPLADLLDELPADRLADRFPGPPSGTIDDRHLAGPDELVAVLGTPAEELEGQPGTYAVHRIRTEPQPYQFTDFLRIMLGVGMVGLIVPVVVFVSTSTRLGAARREQRFAALRLAGATPRQVNLVAAAEAAAAAALGALVGAAGFLAARAPAARLEIDGHRSFVSDLSIAPPLFAAIVVGIPVVAALAAMASLRRLQISPLGVARRAVRSRPTARRLLPFGLGSAGFALSLVAARDGAGPGELVPVMGTFALMILGIVAAGPWFTVLAARALAGLGRGAPVLLAGRRLQDDPASGFRAVSGLVLATFVASVFCGVTPTLRDSGRRSEAGGLVGGSTLAAALPDGTTTAAAVGALEAASAAGGGPGAVVHADPDPDRPLADPARGRRPTVLVACDDAATLRLVGPCPAGGSAWVELDGDDRTVEPAPYSTAEVREQPAALLVVETDGTPATTDRARTAIAAAVPGTFTWTGAERATEANRRLAQLDRLVNLGLAFCLVVAGCSLAVAVAGGITERKRPFALLRLSGMHLRELQRVALLEAAAPLLLIATASAVLGLATAAAVVGLVVGAPWAPPAPGYWAALAGGLVVALGVSAATLPLLGRVTAPSAVRFE